MSNYWNKKSDTSAPIVVSPGPITPEGKAISSKNALKHGSCADTLILKHETQADYDQIRTLWFKAYNPKGEAEVHLVQELTDAEWFHQRATRNVNNIEAELFETEPNPLNWTEQQQRTLTRFLRYQTTRANAVTRARKAVEDYRKARVAEVLTQERHAIYKEKNKPEPTLAESLEMMTKKSIELGLLNPDGSPRSK